MTGYSYKTVAAPRRLKKMKGVRGKEALLAKTIEELISVEAAQGWEYQRADTFPVEEKSGLFSRSSVEMRAVLVFRRAIAAQHQPQPQAASRPAAASAPQQVARPHPAQPHPEPRSEPGFSNAGAQPPRGPLVGGAND